ncbi:DNA-binding response regulator [Jidongwangia harbinensis]|uniref:DNA-binding response regulator n=1 Tax=Jidongwangia harbinensis TaxID=2878561 RepID=UPI001CDA2943|nr:DNA-binding response regulator [Jidongwangia harbinensis]MCA2216267.1 DNA-binding response regulator [Jidongwangia harbinensis]MCA2217002.1 DNA-binding response regulator [Jidongwangia harbinensis]
MLHVAVLDPLPLFGQGAATVLAAAGHEVQVPEDVRSWAESRRPAVVLLTLLAGPDWGLLVPLRDMPEVAVIAVLQDLHPAAIRAVRMGARSVLLRTAGPAALLRTVEATADGQAVLPAELLSMLADAPQAGPATLSEERLSWLRRLAAGSTVADLADTAGYSERAMYRILKQIYRDMGVSNRMQAVLRAQELGWLPGEGSSVRGA